ncbi:MAG TPA: NUDIX domain-containing protein [Candidatus Saccharimonadales bacterium]|nr:NUDIX domain-containing protein [Candidatus Saccharimonadales bacterium]
MMQTPKPKFDRFKKYFNRRRPVIQEVVRETTAGGIIFRRTKDNQIEILLAQDLKNRWTIAKGHVEVGEITRDTAEREIREETGLQEMKVLDWLGKVHFRYRRQNSLVLMTMHVYLVQALGDTDKLKKDEDGWMTDLGWFPLHKALDMIEYDDIGKLTLIGMKKIRDAGL